MALRRTSSWAVRSQLDELTARLGVLRDKLGELTTCRRFGTEAFVHSALPLTPGRAAGV
jgi:hypothetical protein